jgi:hypothetical protein
VEKKVRLETTCLMDTKEYIKFLGHGSLTVGLEIVVEQHKKYIALHDSVQEIPSARGVSFLKKNVKKARRG